MTNTLLPLLEGIILKAKGASTEDNVAQKLGTEGGRDVTMMLHHSRDTEAKQWDETWVLALDALARLFRGFLPQLEERPAFKATWTSLLSLLRLSLLSLPRSNEVALASINAAHNLMLSSARASLNGRRTYHPAPTTPLAAPSDAAAVAPESELPPASPSPIPVAAPLSPQRDSSGGPVRSPDGLMTTPGGGAGVERERLPSHLWATVWALLESVVDEATADAEAFATHQTMLCELVKRTTELYDGGRPYFEEADVLRLLQLGERLARPAHGALGWDPTLVPCAPTPLQHAVLGLLGKLPPFHHARVREDEMWPLLLWLLLKLIEPHELTTKRTIKPTGEPPSTAPVAKSGAVGSRVVNGFAGKCHALLHTLLTEQAGPAAKLAVVEDVLNVLRRVMMWRLHPECRCPSLPTSAAKGFVTLLEALVPHLPRPGERGSSRAHAELIEALWTRLSPPVPSLR